MAVTSPPLITAAITAIRALIKASTVNQLIPSEITAFVNAFENNNDDLVIRTEPEMNLLLQRQTL